MEKIKCLVGIVFITLFASSLAASNSTQLPTVLWHGMGDSCCNPFSMGRIKRLIQDRIPGIYVYSVMVGSNIIADTTHGYLGNLNDQIQEICEKIQADEKLQQGFNAVGFSQGSQFLRALAQRCPSAAINNLVTLGGQHEGVYGLPGCSGNASCSLREELSETAYEETIQNHLVQAQYWHDPLNADQYKEGSIFLADINNEKSINEEYRNSMEKLSNFVMVKFLQDSMVVPIESSWFGFYAEGQDEVVLSLNETTLYQEDRLGLKTLNEQGKLQFLEVQGDHLQFDDEWFLQEIVDVYLT